MFIRAVDNPCTAPLPAVPPTSFARGLNFAFSELTYRSDICISYARVRSGGVIAKIAAEVNRAAKAR